MGDLSDYIVEHDKFGRIYNASTFVEFATIVQNLSDTHHLPRYWRGQSDIEWSIQPSAVRRLRPVINDSKGTSPPYTLTLEQWVQEYETKILSQAREAGYGIQDGRTLSDLELLALIQHYGGATRLLDFTHNIYSALWFACNDEKNIDKPGIVVGFDIDRRNLEELKPIVASKSIQDIYSILASHPKKCFLWQPVYALPRMLAQQSVFIISLCYGDYIEKTTLPTHKTSIPTHFTSKNDLADLICICIPSILKHQMRTNWDLWFGYTLRTMFPDLAGFAQSHSSNDYFEYGFFSDVPRNKS